jgi:hypothetical protein
MIFDLQKNETAVLPFNRFDVIIIGAGAAGITLAKTLADTGKSVALVEGGGLEYSNQSQNIYKGVVTGDPYLKLDTARLRFLGGSTNHWAGFCRSFEEVDFQRAYLGVEYKWPIDFKDIEHYKKEACSILEIPSEFEEEKQKSSNIKSIKFQFSPPVRFKEKYFKELETSILITVFVNSNLASFKGSSRKIQAIKIKSYNGNELSLSGEKVVLAMGGIENSRFLLWAEARYQNTFFDGDLPIGRYWMEHPHFTLGQALIDKRKVSKRFYSLTGDAQKKLNIMNCGFRVEYLRVNATKELIRDVLCVAPNLGKKLTRLAGRDLICGIKFRAAWEQAPDKNNKVTLGDTQDAFGIPRVNLYWKKTPLDRKTVKKSVAEFNSWLMEIDGGRIKLDEWMLTDNKYPENDELGGNHHMGGTRMHESKIYGVVDSNCKVYGSENLYVAGSSLFTTGGHNNPTLPIVQLALRLADHLSS